MSNYSGKNGHIFGESTNRYYSHLQVIECPNKRTIFEIDKGWAYDFWFL